MSDDRRSFKDDILAEAEGNILAVQIPTQKIFEYGETELYSKDEIVRKYGGQIISWELAAPLLDYPYYAGFGSMDCHGIVAWTETQVIYIHEYDGSTSVCTLPRNP